MPTSKNTESELELEKIQSEENDAEIDNASYKINSYGTDFTLEILSKKLDDGEIAVPPFQRRYVWPIKKASKLIESFLLGLPVPQIFLYRDEDAQELLVVDGQQRLRSINYFFKERFENGVKFVLSGVKQAWEGKAYSELTEQDKRKFKNSVLRATVFEQTDPADHSSVFEIFERLNTGGMALTLQEIRNCVINGTVNKFLEELNSYSSWRGLLNKPQPDARMKDIEMMLRFFALSEDWKGYKKPMKDFISEYMRENKNIGSPKQKELMELFKESVDFVFDNLGIKAFRLKQSAINIAIFDSVMVALSEIGIKNIKNFKKKYSELLDDNEYKQAISVSTTDIEKVHGRIKIAKKILAK